MSDHDTHDYEHVWPPYGVQIAEILQPDFWNTLSTVEQQRLREIASELDAAAALEPGSALAAIIAMANRPGVRP